MINLPMLAFKMTGIGEYIELNIEEVYGFPHETSYGGGYGAKGILTIHVDNYSVSANHYFTTGELYRFLKELNLCYKKLSGTAVLENTEHELKLKCEFNKYGHVFISGEFQANIMINNILSFEIKTDQTQIKDSINNLELVYEIFGDEKGKKIKT